ncbi:MAG: putative Ig domain-containing protein, partial [Burkholderiales bacterium]
MSWGEVSVTSPASGAIEAYTTLDVSWGADNVARIVIPHADDPLGTGVEEFRFDDGLVVLIQDMVAAAPPAPSFDPQDQDNVLVGSTRDEVFLARAGNDTLEGGPGGDVLDGGVGDDLYVFAQGDGVDNVFDEGGADVVRFVSDIAPDDIVVTSDPFGALTLTLATGDSVTLANWFDETTRVESVEFADGTIWDIATIGSRITIAPATEFDDVIAGTPAGDVIDGLGGHDWISGLGGDDVLEGSAGDDLLQGGAGGDILRGGDGRDNLSDEQGNNFLEGGAGDDNLFANGAPNSVDGGSNFVVGGSGNDFVGSTAMGNVIAFNAGDGQDTIYVLNTLTLSLGGGLTPAALSLSQDGTDLVVAIGASDSIRLTRQFEPDPQAWPQITIQMFGSVHLYDFNAVIERLQTALAEDPSLAVFPLDVALQAHQTGFSETHALGGPLAYLYGTAGNLNALDDTAIHQVLGDASFGTAPQSIAVAASNHAPVVGAPIADQTAAEDAAFRFTLPSDTFSEADAGDALTLTARLSDGSALPAWLAIDLLSGVFSGTPTNDDVATLDVRVTATDAAGAMASDEFALEVLNVNDVPEVVAPLFDQLGNQHAPFSFEVPEGTFVDVDAGDSLRLSAALADGAALPGWLVFDPVVGSFRGTPSEFDVGTMDIQVVATDNSGASASDLFTLSLSDASTVTETHLGTDRRDVIVTGFANDLIEAGHGNDLVHAGAGRDIVVGGKGNDWIAGEAGNDVLQGEEGRDHLLGGLGDDLYRYERRGGHDVIEETGGFDTLILGAGITADRVRLFQRRDDLVVDLKGRDGGVTIKSWFTREASQVERIEFADGTVWGVEEIRNRVKRHIPERRHDDDDDHGHHNLLDGDHGKSESRQHEEQDDERSQLQFGRLADLLEAYLTQKPRYEFELLADELTRADGRGPALSAREIAHRWQAIARYASALSHEHDEDARGAALHRFPEHGLLGGGTFGGGFGYTGSTGMARGSAN